MIQTEKRLRICTFLLICNLLFIWGNSLMPGEASAAFSEFVNSILQWLFDSGKEEESSGGLLRKIAHFTEFASLGLLLSWLFGMLRKSRLYAFACGAGAACVDETIQIFVPERGPAIRDVCIDTCGVVFGMLLLYVGHTYYVRYLKKPLEEK